MARLIATWFGCGYAPVGPGTAGSAAAILMAVAAVYWWHVPVWGFAIAAIALLGPGIWAADVTAKQVGKKDPGMVVVDEVIGQWCTAAGATTFNWKSALGAFLLFRAFDIWKPFPIRKLEALPGGTGIVMDDVLAGIYGAVVLYMAGWFNLY